MRGFRRMQFSYWGLRCSVQPAETKGTIWYVMNTCLISQQMEGWCLTSSRTRSHELYYWWPEGTKHPTEIRTDWTNIGSEDTLVCTLQRTKKCQALVRSMSASFRLPLIACSRTLDILHGKLNREMLYPAKLSSSCWYLSDWSAAPHQSYHLLSTGTILPPHKQHLERTWEPSQTRPIRTINVRLHFLGRS